MKQNRITRKLIITLMLIFTSIMTTFAENIDYDRLIDAIATIESRHNPNAVSSDGSCVGYLQMRKICVRECNNIVGYKKYTYNDRKNKDKSIEMFMVIQKHHNPNNDLIHGIRLWNEGQNYNRKIKTTPYVKKVLQIYNQKRK